MQLESRRGCSLILGMFLLIINVPWSDSKPQNTASAAASGATQQPVVNQSYKSSCYAPQSNYSTEQEQKLTPTVKEEEDFNSGDDAQKLRTAFKIDVKCHWNFRIDKCVGTDEDAVINVLTKRSNQQRLEIATSYKESFKNDKDMPSDLVVDLKEELSGSFENLMITLMIPLSEFRASEIHKALDNWPAQKRTVVEILFTASNDEIKAIKNAYRNKYGELLEHKLIEKKFGDSGRLMLSLVQGRRSENHWVDRNATMKDTEALLSAGNFTIDSNKFILNEVLSTRSYPHLRHVLMEYQCISGEGLKYRISREWRGDEKDALVAMCEIIKNRASFFAKRLYLALKNMDEKQVHRIVVSRCETDMQSIKECYNRIYKKSSLKDAIETYTVYGHYRKTLLALIGESE